MISSRRLGAALIVGAVAGSLAAATSAVAVAVAPVAAVAPVVAAAPAAALTGQGYTAVQPRRLLDTRTSPTAHTLRQGGSVSLRVTGVAYVPASGVEAVVVNVTGITQATTSYLTVYPHGATRPTASNVNLRQGIPRANQVIATVGTSGAITIFNAVGNTDVLVDISGYFLTGSSYTGQAPVRILDTRHAGGAVAAGGVRTVPLTGHGGVPASGVTAVVLNLTAVTTSSGGYLTAYAAGGSRPQTSNLNIGNRKAAAVLVVAPVGASGAVSIYSSNGPTHLIIDVAGWFSGNDDYTPIKPQRVLNTATLGSTFRHDIQFGSGQTAGAVVLSVTAADPDHAGFVTVHAGGTPLPGTSSVNVAAHATTANLVIAQVSGSNTLAVYNNVHNGRVVVDVVGVIRTNKVMGFPKPAPPNGEVGQAYSFPIQHLLGLAPYTSVITAGPLPAGLTLDGATGLVSGTPTTAATTTSTLRVTDASGQSISQYLTIKVLPFASDALWGWGSASLLAVGNPASSVSPLRITTLADVAQAAANATNGYARTAAGTVLAWGTGAYGGLGNNSLVSRGTPGAVPGLSAVTQIAVGQRTAYALKSDGTVWAWGASDTGQLGNGTTVNSAVPVQVSGLASVVAIGAAAGTAYAVKSDGTVQAWGAGGSGERGDGSTTSVVSTPVAVSGLTGVAAVTAGSSTAYAMKTDGTVWSWGAGASGELGTNSVVGSSVPVQVSGLTGVTEVAGGFQFALARKSDGTVWGWGRDYIGQLGGGPVGGISAVPIQVPGVTGAQHVAASLDAGFAVTSGGAGLSWGPRNSYNQLGDGIQAFGTFTQQPAGAVLTPPLASMASSSLTRTILAVGQH